MIYFICSTNRLHQSDFTPIHWLDVDSDYPLAKEYWSALGQDLRSSTWQKAHEHGYSYAGLVEGGRIVSCAGVWRFSETHWEVAAVSTLPDFRNQGYSRRVVAFVTAYILDAGRQPTCSTEDENQAMIATAESAGFTRIPKEQVTWRYPQLPDF